MSEEQADREGAARRRRSRRVVLVGHRPSTGGQIVVSTLVKSIGRHATRDYDPVTGRKRPKS